MAKERILIVGDYTNPGWHPFAGVDVELKNLLIDHYDIELTEHFESLTLKQMKTYQTIIIYTDHWSDKSATVPSLAVSIFCYLAQGGSLLISHFTSISFDDELAQITGAKFRMHPPYRKIKFTPVESDERLIKDVSCFEIEDEAYQFIWNPICERKVFLTYEYESYIMPAAWSVEYALGRLVYILPGHSSTSFHNPSVRQLYLNACNWLTHQT